MQIEDWPHDRDPAAGVSAQLNSLPTSHGISLMPYSFFYLAADLVRHGWRQGGGGVGAQVVRQDLLHLPTPLGCQPPEGVLFTGVIAEQVGADIIEGPLGMANLAGHGILVAAMGRMTHERDCVALLVSLGQEMKLVSFRDDVGWQCLFQTLPEMTILTLDGVCPWAGVHQFGATMAVNADHPLLLMDVRGELVVFNAIWPDRRCIDGLTGEIGRSVFFVKVMFKTAVIIGADPVAVVALQALLIARRCQEAMRGG